MHRPLALRATPILLAATLALGTSLAFGAEMPVAPVNARADGPASEVSQVEGLAGRPAAPATTVSFLSGSPLDHASPARRRPEPSRSSGLQASSTATATPASKVSPTAKPAQTRATTTTSTVWWSRYHGTNHVWMPSLGVSRPVYFYACDRSTYPANVVYRWGCGGNDNVYLFGHNFGVFNALYEAWRDGTLRKGMPVVYADGHGKTRLYRVTTWRVVAPTDSEWAIAAQDQPSLTLQTCADKAGTNRLVVRLVSVAK